MSLSKWRILLWINLKLEVFTNILLKISDFLLTYRYFITNTIFQNFRGASAPQKCLVDGFGASSRGLSECLLPASLSKDAQVGRPSETLQSKPRPSGQNPAIETPLRPRKFPLYLVLKGSKNIFSAFGAQTLPTPYIFVFHCILCIIGPNADHLSTKSNVKTFKYWFWTSGSKFEIF